jgi:SAM-dependent methyltransferase
MVRVVHGVIAFRSADYWEHRYRKGGSSGAGSYGRLARFKADFINAFIARHRIASVLDLGCGDGNLLSLLDVPDYVGVDVSPTVLAECSVRFPQHRFVPLASVARLPPAELTMSIDVIYHLVEDAVFAGHIETLFSRATRFTLIYSSNFDVDWHDAHVRHRRFTNYVAATQPDWRLLAHVPNEFPYDPRQPDDTTSFADFFVFARVATTDR